MRVDSEERLLRRCLVRVATSAAALLLPPVAVSAQAAIDRVQARAYFAEAAALAGEEVLSAWGADLQGPLVFVDRATREVLANVADPEGVLRPENGLYVGTWPDSLAIYNGSVFFAGQQWTMLAWPLPLARHDRARLLAHEMFHRVQMEHALPAANPSNAHLDTEQARIWLRLEWRALQAALGAGDDADEPVRDALLFRTHRQRLFAEGADDERALERNEGLAEYVGVRVAIPAAARAGWALRQLDSYDATAARASIVRNFAYASGPAYGLLLDAAGAEWLSAIVNGDFGALLADASDIRIPTGDLTALVTARATRYGGALLFAEEAARAARRLAQQAEFRQRFASGATLILPATEHVGYSFDPNAVVAFDDGGTVYLTTQVRDDWGLLDVQAGGALILSEDGRVARVVVPAPANPAARPLTGAGWTLELDDAWELVNGARVGDLIVRRKAPKD